MQRGQAQPVRRRGERGQFVSAVALGDGRLDDVAVGILSQHDGPEDETSSHGDLAGDRAELGHGGRLAVQCLRGRHLVLQQANRQPDAGAGSRKHRRRPQRRMLQADEVAKLVQRHRLDKVVGGEVVVVIGEPTMVDAIEHHVRLDNRVIIEIHRKRHRQRAADLHPLVVDQHSPVRRGFFHPVNDIRVVLAIDIHAGRHQTALLKFQDRPRHRLPLADRSADGVQLRLGILGRPRIAGQIVADSPRVAVHHVGVHERIQLVEPPTQRLAGIVLEQDERRGGLGQAKRDGDDKPAIHFAALLTRRFNSASVSGFAWPSARLTTARGSSRLAKPWNGFRTVAEPVSDCRATSNLP